MVVSSLGGAAELWHNTSPGEQAWLNVRLVGTESNRDGIGATVRAGRQANVMTSAVGYASSSHDGVHFGLGASEEIAVQVTWPGGTVQDLGRVSANQALEVREPQQVP